jgi:hypothetical protein
VGRIDAISFVRGIDAGSRPADLRRLACEESQATIRGQQRLIDARKVFLERLVYTVYQNSANRVAAKGGGEVK